MDSSVVIPPVFELQKQIIDFHISTNNDILLQNKPSWFVPCIYVELIFQLPFFFYAVYTYKSTLLDILNIVYAVNASFSTFVCISWILAEGASFGLSVEEKVKLALIYLPYVIIPVVIGVGSSKEILKKVSVSEEKKTR